jgi:crossover junction endodeoxyribonuclease RuvC
VIPLVVAGVDLSLTGTGLAVVGHVDDGMAWSTRTVKTGPVDTEAKTHRRLVGIVDEVVAWCTSANLVVIERPTMGGTSGRGSHAVDRCGLYWLVLDRLYMLRMPVAVATSSNRCKYATGKGNASKDTVLAAAIRRWTDAPIQNNNDGDAVVLAAMGADWLGAAPVPMPAANRTTLPTVQWPVGYETRQVSDTPLPL